MNLSKEYRVIYLRFKHHFDPKEISWLLDISEADVRYILATEANECARQRYLAAEDEIKERYRTHKRKGDNQLLTQNIQLAQ